MFEAVVLTLGFEPGPLVSAFAGAVAEGLSEGALVVVFTAGFPDERSERAWLEFQRVVNMMEAPRRLGVELELREVPLDDMATAILEIRRVLDGLRGKKVKVALTGGMRALGLAVFSAILLTRWADMPEVEVYLEGRGTALKIPDLKALIRASEKCIDLVEVMKSGPAKLDELAKRLGKDRTTVYRKLRLLLNAGAAKKTPRGYELTPIGLALANL
ncbi:MAG: CRISPR-associated CARF protein Csa3 [Thermofilum sp.]|nr:CRISPR-associated CARF protein Csa3 [Thermofilum sp.]